MKSVNRVPEADYSHYRNGYKKTFTVLSESPNLLAEPKELTSSYVLPQTNQKKDRHPKRMSIDINKNIFIITHG
jgi:predicted transcriptional regulator